MRRARAKFEEGLALSDEGKWSEALEAFRRSDELVPSATVQFNIAVTLRALGRYVEAKHAAERILSEAKRAKHPLRPRLRRDVERLLEEVSAKIARVRLRVTPAGARVQIDGSSLEELPDGRIELDPGRHVCVVSAQGHETTTLAQTIEPGESEVVLRAPPRRAPPETSQEPTLWYESGWFWGIAGSVAAASAATAIIVVAVQPEQASAAGPPASTIDQVIPAVLRF